ncbi:ABC transporter ATP-binding protein, partial [Clostridium sp.]|nr:ABC transporter ATP-binding protein [Clostridium sp.]
FIRSAKIAKDGQLIKFLKFDKDLKNNMKELKMDNEYAKRYLNVGFSGGEKKKNEILQMLMLSPKLAILDETDSGLDVDAIRIVSQGIKMFANEENGVLIITHNTKILENLKADYVHVLVNGKIVKTGDATLAKEIEQNGYEAFKAEAAM